jgi:hypothetical protein
MSASEQGRLLYNAVLQLIIEASAASSRNTVCGWNNEAAMGRLFIAHCFGLLRELLIELS